MNTFGYVLFAALLGVAAYFGQQWWSQSQLALHRKMIRTMETLAEIKEHAKEFDKPEVIKVTENIYMAIGFAIANSIMIIGPDGIVIVDVTESYEAGSEVFAAFRKITKKPVTDIVYSHNHGDHCWGAKGFIEDENNPPNIWAHSSIEKSLLLNNRGPTIAKYTRALRQFGVLLPDDVSAGIGFKLKIGEGNSVAMVYPNKFVSEKETDVVLAGIPMKIIHIPGETDDQIGVWIPESKAFLCADDIYKAFPNLYAIRGTTARNLLQWVSSIDTMIDFEPEVLVPSHTRPVTGSKTIHKLLSDYRDAIQFTNDQTIRMINHGYHPDEIASALTLPESLTSNNYLKEFYGTLMWSSKSVFNENLGWFSGDPVELNPLTRNEKSERMVALVGAENLIKTARDAYKKGDFQWALELSTYVLRYDSTHKDARSIKVESLTELGARQISNNGRNYYLTSAMEIANEVRLTVPPTNTISAFIEELPISMSIATFSVRFKPESCDQKNETLLIELSEPVSNHFIQLRNSVAIIKSQVPKQWDLKMKCTEKVLKDIVSNKRSSVAAVALGDLEIEGGILALGTFFDCFERNIQPIEVL